MPKFKKQNQKKRTEVDIHIKRFQSSNQADLIKANEVPPFYLRF